jgi:predicted lipoprotein with Yx(FWY)xxD motif
MFRSRLLSAALASSVLVACASVAGPGVSPPVNAAGGMLTGTGGMTLYTFDNDAAGSGKSACNGPCAQNWPPLAATDADRGQGDYSVVTRDDGSKQWAYKGKPLYFWAKDAKPGDATGDGVKGVWHVAKP